MVLPEAHAPIRNRAQLPEIDGLGLTRGSVVPVQVARSDELHQQASKYCAQLQEYNGRLQSDAQGAAERLKTLQVGASIPLLDRPSQTLGLKHCHQSRQGCIVPVCLCLIPAIRG